MERIVSIFGLLVMMGLAWLLGSHRRKISLRIVGGGLLLQLVFAIVILKTTLGGRVFQIIGDFFRLLLDFVDEGSVFVFGPEYEKYFFAFKVLPTIVFFSSLMSVLYHYGIMQQLIKLLAVVMQRTLGTSGAETLSATANIFVGQTEAPLVIRPYIETMTDSELMVVMVGGFATIAGGVMAAYVGMGIDPVHLLSASVISAPAAMLIAKIMQPEVGKPETLGQVNLLVPRTTVNGIHAAAQGAADGAKLAINVAAMLIAFLGLLALLNYCIAWLGGLFGQSWSLQALLGQLFAPLAWTMGVEWADCQNVGQLLGMKMVANEFPLAYHQLSEWLKEESTVQISARSQMIVTYALCGFANFGSIGVQLGGIGPLAPKRQSDLARLGLRAMLGGTLAAFMTACVAGALL